MEVIREESVYVMVNKELIRSLEKALDFWYWLSIGIETPLEQRKEAVEEINRLNNLLKKYKGEE